MRLSCDASLIVKSLEHDALHFSLFGLFFIRLSTLALALMHNCAGLFIMRHCDTIAYVIEFIHCRLV